MATLSITINDASLSRVQEAFGHASVIPGQPWVNATNSDIRQAIMEYVRSFVRRYEEAKASNSAIVQVTDI
jgi:hypothetical protein